MSIADRQRAYYDSLYQRHGDDPKSLAHNDRATQDERFFRIARSSFGDERGAFTVHEIGCGLGDFGAYLARRHPRAQYSGSDVCEPFVQACRQRLPHASFFLRDVSQSTPEERYDYLTQSGLFNIPAETPRQEWQEFIFAMLSAMFAMARRAVCVNFLTGYSETDRMRPDLHYQDEKQLLDFAVSRLSRHVALDLGGPLYEFTLVVWRPEHVRAQYPDSAFQRYFRER